MKKILLVLVLLLIVGAIGYAIYNFSPANISSMFLRKGASDTQRLLDQKLQSGMQYINSGMQTLQSGAQNLLQSGQALFDEKKQQAEEYLREQKEQLKADAQKALQDAAKDKINSLFSGSK